LLEQNLQRNDVLGRFLACQIDIPKLPLAEGLANVEVTQTPLLLRILPALERFSFFTEEAEPGLPDFDEAAIWAGVF